LVHGVDMQIQSSRFGKIEVNHSDMLLMPHGLIGFETCRHWVLLSSQDNEDVAWLQSVALANVAVPVVSPRRFAPNYQAHVQRRDMELLHLHNDDKLYVLSIVSKSGATLTANLKSPILLNASRQIALQVVVTDDQPLAVPLRLTESTLAISRKAA
jgi:flagellar assembly factor FliW